MAYWNAIRGLSDPIPIRAFQGVYKLNNGTWTTVLSGLDTSAEWSFCNFQGNLSGINLIGANGVDPIKRYDGNTAQNLSGAPVDLDAGTWKVKVIKG